MDTRPKDGMYVVIRFDILSACVYFSSHPCPSVKRWQVVALKARQRSWSARPDSLHLPPASRLRVPSPVRSVVGLDAAGQVTFVVQVSLSLCASLIHSTARNNEHRGLHLESLLRQPNTLCSSHCLHPFTRSRKQAAAPYPLWSRKEGQERRRGSIQAARTASAANPLPR